MTTEQLEAYYKRICYFPQGGPSAENLRNIHKNQALHIPFENMDVYRGKGISLDPEDLFNKIVVRRRGGYCFELNGLMADALISGGYKVKRVVARLDGKGMGFGGHLHCGAIVDVDGSRYICDVGYGAGGFTEPLKLELGTVQKVLGGIYRVVSDPDHGYVIQLLKDGEFKGYMAIRDQAALNQDFEIGNYYTSTNPNSGFRRFVMCTIPTEEGRISISDNYVKIVSGGSEETIPLNGMDEVYAALKKYLHLELD